MSKRSKIIYAEDVEEINFCDNKIYKISGGVYEIPNDVKRIEGEFHKVLNCENCIQTHSALLKGFTEKFNGNDKSAPFPLCCSYHAELLKIKEFNRDDFKDVPRITADKIIYTYSFILNKIKSENWTKHISDYLEWVVDSFGDMPKDCGEPLFLSSYLKQLKQLVINSTKISQTKKGKILEIIGFHQSTQSDIRDDLKELINAYNSWYKSFPFELKSYFKDVKDIFSNQFEIIFGEQSQNLYSGEVKTSLRTKDNLFKVLISVTECLLNEFNGVNLLEKGLVSDAEMQNLELIKQKRKQKLKDGYNVRIVDAEQRYKKMINIWLDDEIEFFKNITPIINKQNDNKADIEFDEIDDEIFLYSKIPFEIEFIYKDNYSGSGQRFMKVKSNEYNFYTPARLYHWFIEDYKKGELFTEDLIPLSHETLQPFYKAYGQGFIKGYKEFDDKIKKRTTIFQDNSVIIQKIFEVAITSTPGLCSYGSDWVEEKMVKTVSKEVWFNAGIKSGENYKAWYFIINNSSLFVRLFRSHKPYIEVYKEAANRYKDDSLHAGSYSNLKKLLTEVDDDWKINEVESTRINKIFTQYGFEKLPSIKSLSDEKVKELVEMICRNDIPYKIAMLDAVGFLSYLKENYFQSGYLLQKSIAEWLNTTPRTIKGNINVLNPKSKEDRSRYTAHARKNQVKKDYDSLK